MMHEWSTMKRLIYLRGNPATGGGGGSPLTVTGATPLLMPGAVAKPLRAATFQISPVQSGSGDPSPSNVRPITGWTGANVTVTGMNLWKQAFPCDVSGVYDGWYIPYTDKIRIQIIDKGNNADVSGIYFGMSGAGDGPSGGANWVLQNGVVMNNGYRVTEVDHYVSIYPIGAQTLNKLLARYDVMVSYGAEYTPYTPYSGTSLSVAFPAMGKNLFDGQLLEDKLNNYFIYSDDGTIEVKASYYLGWTARPIVCTLQAGTYTFSATDPSSNNVVCEIRLGDAATVTKVARSSNSFQQTFTIDEPMPVRFGITSNNVGDSAKVQIEAGSSKTTFEPFTNTVYSGTIDPVTGQGVVTHGKLNFDDFPAGYSWQYQSNYNRFYYSIGFVKGSSSVLSDIFPSGSTGIFSDNLGRVFVKTTTITDLETFLSTISGHYIVYELPTPLTFTVSPQTLTPPAGDAYIWADCGSTAEVTYIGKP